MENRNRKKMSPMIDRKVDITQNDAGLNDIITQQLKRERNLYPLRITGTTVIYVTKAKCTKEYAEKYKREKMGL